ncbi:MAG: hypothetical protein EP330_01600 [Deltaproteobacteria bacterium]|nr:MAG: hypothetical protein EP330_01600 [Deltaproteobacteria bacterium]
MRSGTIQLQLDNGDLGLGAWWAARGREATRLLRRYLPELSLTARQLADLLDGDAVLVVVRVGGSALAEVCADEVVRLRVATLASELNPRTVAGRRRREVRRVVGKTEAA